MYLFVPNQNIIFFLIFLGQVEMVWEHKQTEYRIVISKKERNIGIYS